MKVYQNKSGELLRLRTQRQSGIHTFVKINSDFEDVTEKQDWHFNPQKVTKLIKGFRNLKEYLL